LKPANIKLRPDGTVKVLDFGLAKAMEPTRPTSVSHSLSPTITTPAMTQVGMILGTAAYMSPEQARGKPVDKRTDIWAFGCVLYELLTARRAFDADGDVGDTLAAILRGEVDWRHLPADTSGSIRRLLRRCLEKDPHLRLHDIADARLEIEDALSRTESDAVVTTPATFAPAAPLWRRFLPWAVALVLAFTLLGVVMWPVQSRPSDDRRLTRFDIDLDVAGSANLSIGPDVVISPDGARLVYVSNNRLVTRRLDEKTPSVLPNTDGANDPFFSPDGRWVGFFAAGQLKRISVERGAAVPVANAPNSFGASWGDDDTIVAAIGNGGALMRIPLTGGTPTPITKLAPGERDHHWPQVLPGARAVLFTANTRIGSWDQASVEVVSLRDGQRKTLVRGGTFGRYFLSGHLVYVNGGTLFAVPFDLETQTIRGTPVPVLEDIAYSTANGSAQFTASDNGVLIHRSAMAAELFTVQWMEKTGDVHPLLAKPAFYVNPRLSPDGRRLAIAYEANRSDIGRDIWIWDSQRDLMTRLSFEGSGYSVWTPDSRYVVFSTFRPPSENSALRGMAWTRSDGGGKPEPLTQSDNPQWPWSVTADGKRLAYQESNVGSGWDIWTVPIEQSGGALRAGKPEMFLQSPFDERNPAFSPDGRWIAYSSNEFGQDQIYVSAFPNGAGKWLVSMGQGRQPVWSRTAHELLFRAGDGRIMVARYTVMGDSFVAETPRPWSSRALANVNINGVYDLAPDGQRVVALMPAVSEDDRPRRVSIVLLQHFFDELQRVAPAGH
jgi:serine/threonine-protein kinase